MKREMYKGRKLTARALKGSRWGYVETTINGHKLGAGIGTSETAALTQLHNTIDFVDSLGGIDGDRFEAHWYTLGTYEMCSEDTHPQTIGGPCNHAWCREQARKGN